MKLVVAATLGLGATFKFGLEGIPPAQNVTIGAKAFGSQNCPCIGFAGVDGTAMVRVGEHYVAYPGELGSRCAAWDDDQHPESCREGQMPGKGKGWCKQPWCYVDPRNCDLKVAPRLSEYVPTARYQNMPLFYSYATCGGEELQAKDAMQPGCECVGIENKAGSIKANLEGVPIRYPGEAGGSCKAWDLEQNPLCAVKGAKPSFCTQKWCYVDPCKCGVKAPPKEAVYFNATMRGKTVYYSYEACGSNDTFTLGYNKNACINAKDEKACGLLPKCAWSGSSCFGKELVVPELCSADQVYNGTKVEDLRSSSWSRPMLSLAAVLTLFS